MGTQLQWKKEKNNFWQNRGHPAGFIPLETDNDSVSD